MTVSEERFRVGERGSPGRVICLNARSVEINNKRGEFGLDSRIVSGSSGTTGWQAGPRTEEPLRFSSADSTLPLAYHSANYRLYRLVQISSICSNQPAPSTQREADAYIAT